MPASDSVSDHADTIQQMHDYLRRPDRLAWRPQFDGFFAQLLAERQQLQAKLEVAKEVSLMNARLADELRAERQQAIDALRGLDAPLQWIAENYPAVWDAMPSEFYRRFSEARAALVQLGEKP